VSLRLLDQRRESGILAGMTDPTDNKDGNDDRASYYQWVGIGLEFCTGIAVLTYVGYRLDQAFNTSPWLLILFSFLGFAGMLYMLIRQAMNMPRR
jgi:F0F1-type ATP synthase assembly protein I